MPQEGARQEDAGGKQVLTNHIQMALTPFARVALADTVP
jgi:hypothetical protein